MPCSAPDPRQWLVPAPLLLALLAAGCAAVDAAPTALPTRHSITASGRIDAASDARFLVAERDGIIRAVLVRRDQIVAAGQPLVAIACDDASAALDAARAQAAAALAQQRLIVAGPRREARSAADARVRAAEAMARDAADRLVRAQGLETSGFVSQRQLLELQAARSAADANLAALRAEASATASGSRPDERRAARAATQAAQAVVRQHAAAVGQCMLRAPTAGRIVQIFRREGEFTAASSGAPVLVLADLSRLIVRAEIADRDAALARTGQQVEVWIDGDRRRWPGRIVALASLMGRKTARSLDPSDRFDRDVREAIIAFAGDQPPAIVGLRVNVGVFERPAAVVDRRA